MAAAPCPAKLPATSARALSGLVSLMHVLSATVPPRTAVRQIEALFVVAYASAMGRNVTVKDVVDAIDPGGGAKAVERSIHQFTQPSKFYPDALDWIEQEIDPEDRRKKYLVLTRRGVDVIQSLLPALAEAAEGAPLSVRPLTPAPAVRPSEPESEGSARLEFRYPRLSGSPNALVPARLRRLPSGIWQVDYLDLNTGERRRVSCRTRDRKRADLVARRIVYESLMESVPSAP